ncbi:uncharacterized protein LOC127108975 [Lathyrus oleraceus]|uniref:uncharacterized protein LOC127108975 n=1 Tax=Pisum sativum TaxID=3888 RepID=UPI0021CF82EB|nr:uncharacterized protein LOC127108975 [Pisum sativum]
MAYVEEQKVLFGTYMLQEKGEDWWDNAHQIPKVVSTNITWVVFITRFLEKYFPGDVRCKKDIQFLKMKLGNMSVVEYAAKFEEVVKFCPYYNVNTCRIYDEDSRARFALYKSLSEKKGKNQYRGKLHSAPANKGKHNTSDQKKLSGGETPASIKYCKSDEPTCYNCCEHGHISTHCLTPKKVQYGRRLFALTRSETTSSDILIKSMCFINVVSLIDIINTGARHSFISLDCAERLGLKLSYMTGNMVIETLTPGLVTTSWACLNCSLTIYGKSFGLDLVCLPLNKLDVVLRMNWLEFNHVHINYFDKSVSFPGFDASDELFVSVKQVDEFIKDDAEMFMILAYMKAKSKVVIDE